MKTYENSVFSINSFLFYTAIICPTVSGVNASPLMNATYYFNDTLEFACDEGFKEDSGNTTLYCSIDETWIGDPLNCTGTY